MYTIKTSEGFLRPAAHEGVLSRASIPNFHSVSDRCWSPISYFVRSTRVSLSIGAQTIVPKFLYELSIAADKRNCQVTITSQANLVNCLVWPCYSILSKMGLSVKVCQFDSMAALPEIFASGFLRGNILQNVVIHNNHCHICQTQAAWYCLVMAVSVERR